MTRGDGSDLPPADDDRSPSSQHTPTRDDTQQAEYWSDHYVDEYLKAGERDPQSQQELLDRDGDNGCHKLNRSLLDFVNSKPVWHASAWHDCSLASKHVWAKRVEHDAQFHGRALRAGQWICRGPGDLHWIVEEGSFEKDYTTMNGEAARNTRKGEFVRYQVKPSSATRVAARVNDAFVLHNPKRGAVVKGRPGDYVMKHSCDKDVPYPTDVWVVSARAFHQLFNVVDPSQETNAAVNLMTKCLKKKTT